MPDYKYTFPELGVHSVSHAARLAVLWPIMTRVGNTPQGQLMALASLLMSWRNRTKELADYGHKRLKSKKNLQYVRNCLPTMARVSEPDDKLGRECKLRDICPWCYSRRVMSIYERIQDRANKDDKIVCAHYAYKETLAGFSPDALKVLMCRHRKLLSKLAAANADTSHGICWSLTLSPDDKEELAVTVNCNLLAVLAPTESLDLVPSNWSVSDFADVSSDSIRHAVSKTFKYPSGMIHGSIPMTVAILQAREKLRLTDSCGLFRK